MTEMRFFVYGSMSEGFVHFSKISDFVESSTPGSTLAAAYRLKVGFPVLLEESADQALDKVPGTMLRMKAVVTSELLLSLMDEFHGFNRHDESKSLHVRRLVSVRTSEGDISSWCYFLNPTKLPNTAVRIDGGNWRASLEQEPALTEKLTERQRTYVQRLGSSVGREIVPINLSLYRELMNLELIVDKGRRLALSKLGQEVYRYLT
jgi:gamma-glutamylcyclotransferase (GGCT)/AIG2-like uncharacterized protein YtfP